MLSFRNDSRKAVTYLKISMLVSAVLALSFMPTIQGGASDENDYTPFTVHTKVHTVEVKPTPFPDEDLSGVFVKLYDRVNEKQMGKSGYTRSQEDCQEEETEDCQGTFETKYIMWQFPGENKCTLAKKTALQLNPPPGYKLWGPVSKTCSSFSFGGLINVVKLNIEASFDKHEKWSPKTDGTSCIQSPISPKQRAILDNGRTDRLDDIVWDFDWSDCEGATQYHLFVKWADAKYPVINDNMINNSSYHYVNKGAYIVNRNRYGRIWKVRVKVDGQWSEWSETRTFDVEPVNTDPPS